MSIPESGSGYGLYFPDTGRDGVGCTLIPIEERITWSLFEHPIPESPLFLFLEDLLMSGTALGGSWV